MIFKDITRYVLDVHKEKIENTEGKMNNILACSVPIPLFNSELVPDVYFNKVAYKTIIKIGRRLDILEKVVGEQKEFKTRLLELNKKPVALNVVEFLQSCYGLLDDVTRTLLELHEKGE